MLEARRRMQHDVTTRPSREDATGQHRTRDTLDARRRFESVPSRLVDAWICEGCVTVCESQVPGIAISEICPSAYLPGWRLARANRRDHRMCDRMRDVDTGCDATADRHVCVRLRFVKFLCRLCGAVTDGTR